VFSVVVAIMMAPMPAMSVTHCKTIERFVLISLYTGSRVTVRSGDAALSFVVLICCVNPSCRVMPSSNAMSVTPNTSMIVAPAMSNHCVSSA